MFDVSRCTCHCVRLTFEALWLQALEPHTTPLFVSAVRLLPAGALLVGWATTQNRKQPSGVNAWFAISLFALADATCFQVRHAKWLFCLDGMQAASACRTIHETTMKELLRECYSHSRGGWSGVLRICSRVWGVVLRACAWVSGSIASWVVC